MQVHVNLCSTEAGCRAKAHLLRLEDRERLRERLSLPLRERLRE
jgi:hypothetical protein